MSILFPVFLSMIPYLCTTIPSFLNVIPCESLRSPSTYKSYDRVTSKLSASFSSMLRLGLIMINRLAIIII